MNAAAILALIADLYQQVVQLQNENERLRQQIDRRQHGPKKEGLADE